MTPAARDLSSPRGAYEPRSVRAGEWTLTALTDGSMRLDGGSMWGVVPKTMWERMTPPSADNTIEIALRPFLARKDGLVVVIEAGVGQRWDEKWRSIYRIEQPLDLAESLAACGVGCAEVTHVVASHCHFDHIGALVVERQGELVPLFPNAVHFAPTEEVVVAKDPDAVRSASYRAEDVAPLETAGLLETYDGSCELLPGIRAHEAGGHSDAVHVITINEDEPGDTAIFWADVVPTTHHVQPAYMMAYDLDQARSFASRSTWLARAAAGNWIGLFYHDAEHAFGRIRRDGKRYLVEPLVGERLVD